MRGRVGAEDEAVLFRRVVERIENNARLEPGAAPTGVDLQQPVAVLGEIDDNRDIATLPREARATAPIRDRCAEASADLDRRHSIARVAREDDADRHLPVV